jgi:hypothetical protein
MRPFLAMGGRILFLVVSPAMAKNGLICGIGVEAA